MKKILSVIMGISFAFAGLINGQNVALAADGPAALSPYGDSTMQDLASCLRTANKLDVFYLIDNSKSLGADPKSGSPGTDPSFLRADIVAQDIKRWSDILKIQPKLQISVAGAFFAGSSSPLTSWTDLTATNAGSVASSFKQKIKAKALDYYTNWTAGLQEAYSQLQGSSADCKAVVWFTDGGLWSQDPRVKSLNDLSTLCGPGTSPSSISSSPSADGLMAKIRKSKINVFGIMLSPNADSSATGEKNEGYYKSLMLPVIEETGPKLQSVNGLPGGKLVCGELASSENRTYSTGAFLKAVSAAQIAYSFLLLNSKVAGGTAQQGSTTGKFWLDPGIRSFEVLTSAKNWQIIDATGKVQSTSEGSQYLGTTGRVEIPRLTKSQAWTFKSDSPFTVIVYPELYLSLHDNAVFSGRKNSISGQFVSNLSTGVPATLSDFTKANISAWVNGKPAKASITPSGVFQLDPFTPEAGAQSLAIKATLSLQTEHHPDLAPLNFALTKPVLQPQSLPMVSKIIFRKPLVGSKGRAIAKFLVSAPNTGGQGVVCFAQPKVLADNQDQSSGGATPRSKHWKINFKSLDKRGCIAVTEGSTKNLASVFTNDIQADSSVQLLFDYSLASGDGFQVSDSQNVILNTKRNTQGGLFWLWFIGLSILSILIPYSVLYIISSPAARIYSSAGLDRGVAKFTYYPDSKYVANSSGSSSFDPIEASKLFSQLSRSLPIQGMASFTDDDTGARIVAYRAKWPLNPPKFVFIPPLGKLGVPVGKNSDSTKITFENSRLTDGQLSNLAFVILENDAQTKAKANGQIAGELVVFNADQSGDYAGALANVMSGGFFAQNVDSLLAAHPGSSGATKGNVAANKPKGKKQPKSKILATQQGPIEKVTKDYDEYSTPSSSSSPGQNQNSASADPYSDI